jgi:hypothetical protein
LAIFGSFLADSPEKEGFFRKDLKGHTKKTFKLRISDWGFQLRIPKSSFRIPQSDRLPVLNEQTG